MKNTPFPSARLLALVAAFLSASAEAQAAMVFTDNFDAGPSPLWGNESGSWLASAGGYYATAPNNQPNAYSSLPFNLTDFTVDFDIINVSDGGIFLRAAPAPGTTFGIEGVLLILKVPAGGPRLYWHVFYDGNQATPPLNITYLDFGTTPHVHVEVSGDTFSAFVNGSATPATTLTTNVFSSGRMALYDFSSESFGDVVLQTPDPQLFIRMDPDAAVIYWSTNFPTYALQTAADLSEPAAWSPVGGPYAAAGGFYQFRLPTINLLDKQFFRLSTTLP